MEAVHISHFFKLRAIKKIELGNLYLGQLLRAVLVHKSLPFVCKDGKRHRLSLRGTAFFRITEEDLLLSSNGVVAAWQSIVQEVSARDI